MRAARLLKILAGLIALVIVVLVVALLVIDPNEYKDEIIAAVEDKTGRGFTIESDIDFKIGLTPSLAVRDVRLANATWGSRPDMLSVGEFAAEVALIPLVLGNLQINRLVLRDADILIETDTSGRSNLDFEQQTTPEDAKGGDVNLPQINNVVVQNAVVTVIDGATDKTTKLEVERLSAAAESLSSPLVVDLAAIITLDGQAIEFSAEGQLGAANQFLAGRQPYPVNLQVNALGLTLNADGVVAEPAQAKGLSIKFEAAGTSLQGLAPLAGEDLPSAGPFSLRADISGDSDNIALKDIDLKLGETTVAGQASIDVRGKRPLLMASINAERINVSELLPGQGPGEAPVESQSDKIFSPDPLPLESLKAADARIEFEIAQLYVPSARLTDVKGKLALDNGALAIKPLSAAMVGSLIDGDLAVDARGGPATVSLDVRAPNMDLGELLREVARLDNLRGSGAFEISVRGSGNSVAAIMGSLNGHSRLLMNQGEMKNEFLGNISGLTQTLGEAFGKKEWIVVECIASDFEVVNGVANSRVNVINTELLVITAQGKVDLGQEKPNLKVSPSPKKIDLSLAVPVNIGGTLANPTFTPDTLATAKKVGGLLGAIAFPPAAIIGLGELGGGDNPCLQIADAEAPAQSAPSTPKAPIESATDAAKDTIRGVGEGLRKLFGN